MLEKSYVSIGINIGSFANPKNYEGLAHFLEHMLFMGSKKYPDENYYNTRLNEMGGYSNAYTAEMETIYYFSVFDNGMEEMLDIFSRFFIDPLFKEDSVKREMNAVNSEYMKNINSDMLVTKVDVASKRFFCENLFFNLNNDKLVDSLIVYWTCYC